jgi:anti-sigma regulatory factor (Ser/Thr protein kinase)
VTSRLAVPVEHPGEARRLVRSKLVGVSGQLLEIAQTLVSELVSNALVHGDGTPMLIAEVENGHLHVEILDSEPTVALAPLPLDPTRERGRGLAIVDALASDWGVESRSVGKAVWFNLQLNP